MAVKVFAVRVGNRYGPEYETYLKEKIPNIEFINDDQLNLQWNKVRFFNLDLDEPVCVIDIDIELINDYMKLFEYEIKPGEFLTMNPWWSNSEIQGGFYKFYPSDTKYIYDEFMSRPDYWRNKFIENNTKPGPINGEENFVYELVKQKLKIKYLPNTWFTRYHKDKLIELNKMYPGNYMYLDDFNPEIKFVHYNSIGNLRKSLE